MEPYVGEFFGTALLILLGNGVVANVVLPRTKAHASGWIVIAFGWGMAVFVAVWCFGAISGAHINPAVTVGLAAAGQFAWSEAWAYIAAQLLGAFAGAVVVYLVYRDHYAACDNGDAQLATFSTTPAIRSYANNAFCEVIGTFVLVLAVLMATEPSIDFDTSVTTATEESEGVGKIGLGSLGALPVGLLVLAIGLSLGGVTGYAINPARDLGPRVAHAVLPLGNKRDSDWQYAWVPIVGPLLGGLLAAAFVTSLT